MFEQSQSMLTKRAIYTLPVLGAIMLLQSQSASAATIREFPGPESGGYRIITGTDGNLWFTQSRFVGRLTTAGEYARFEIPTPPDDFADAFGITEGADGALWMTDCAREVIYRMTKAGIFSEYALSQSESAACPTDLTAGADGNVWFSEHAAKKIGRITLSGEITEFTLPLFGPNDITLGPDGNLWITDQVQIGRLTHQGHFTAFALEPGSIPQGMAVGPDSALWFARGRAIGRISTTGTLTDSPLPNDNPHAVAIAPGLDGNMWFVGGNHIGRVTPTGSITEFTLPGFTSAWDLTVGPDGNFWISDNGQGRILRFTPGGTPGDTCVPSDTVLCIDDKPGDRRFKIEVQYETAQAGGLVGNGHAVPLASAGLGRGGVFWFFSEDNPEVFIKVLDGCGLNQKHWVFLAAGTNVGYIVTVQDLVSGVVRSYYNVDLKPAPVVQDTDAFPCAGSAP